MVTIYAIECLVNQKCYVGCTAGKLNKRMREHRCLLKKRTHSSKIMTQDWHRYGGGSFRVKTLESSNDPSVELKRALELKWIKHYQSKGLLYNAHLVSFSGTEEAIRKAVEASLDSKVIAKRVATRKKNRSNYCKHGHVFDDKNTIINSKGARICRECKLNSSRKYERKLKR